MTRPRRRAADFPYFQAPFLAFAHRGGATYGPNLRRENTLAAFEAAVALGYRYLETDVHATSDGVLLAFHDAVLDRVTDHHGRLADLSYAEVARARIAGLPIPTMHDLLTAFPSARFNIDAKSDRSVDLLATAIAEHDAWDRVLVSSFGAQRLRRLRRQLGPRVPSAASMAGVAYTRFAGWLTWALNTPAAALQIPEFHRLGGRPVRILTPGLVRVAHRAGKQVHVWTLDEADSMHRVIDLGVDGIFSDRIDILKTVLQQRGLWS